MKYITSIIGIAVIFVGCSNGSSSNNINLKKDTVQSVYPISEAIEKEEISQNIEQLDFLGDSCLKYWTGTIQGVEESRILILGECFKGSYSYDIIGVPKENKEFDSGDLLKQFKSSINDPTIFKVFAILIPKKIQTKPENEFDKYAYILPSRIELYERNKQGEWDKLRGVEINNISELNSLKKQLSELEDNK